MAADLQIVQLRAFATVARLQSYTRAAEQLSYTEPAIYLQVKGLERALGVPLVQRRQGRVMLTPHGTALLPRVEEIVQQVAGLERNAVELLRRPTVVVGAGSNTGVFVLMPRIAAYEASESHFDIELHVHGRDGIIRGANENAFDVIVAATVEDHFRQERRVGHEWAIVPWFQDEWVLVGAPPREGCDGAPIAAHRTVYVPTWGLVAGERLKASLTSCFGTEPRLVALESGEAVRSAAAHGRGPALYPLSAASSAGIGVRVLQRFGRQARLTIYLIHRRGRALSAPSRHFVTFLLSEARARREQAAPPDLIPHRDEEATHGAVLQEPLTVLAEGAAVEGRAGEAAQEGRSL